MEAAAMGVPTVATDIRGCREAVTEASGLLVPTQDSDALAAAIGTVIGDPVRHLKLAQGAMALAAERFDVKHQVELSRLVYRVGASRARRRIAEPHAYDPTLPQHPPGVDVRSTAERQEMTA